MTYVVKVEDISAHALHQLQKDMLTYISTNMSPSASVVMLLSLRPTISFGSRKYRNKFAPKLEKILLAQNDNEPIRDESGTLTKKVHDKLMFEGVGPYSFIESGRGGGSTYVGPGQRAVFFNYHIRNKFGDRDPFLELDKFVLGTMYDTVNSFLAPWIERTGATIGTHPHKDITAYLVDERKLASKGYSVRGFNGRNFSMFGGSFFVQEEGLRGFDLVLPCGFSDLKPTSYEALLGEKADMDEFDRHFLAQLAKRDNLILPDDSRNVMQKNVNVYLQNPTIASRYRS